MNDNSLKKLDDISKKFQQAMAETRKEQEAYWNSLTKQQQLDVFCCVSRRIVEGEIDKKGSYRYVLYQVFGFGAEAYAAAQDAGYLALHNAIIDEDHDFDLLKAFCTKYNIEDAENKILNYLM